MATKSGLGIGMINMYCDMVDTEFQPLVTLLKARTHGIEPLVKRQVKKEWGIYELIARKEALQEELKEIEQQIYKKTGETTYAGTVNGRDAWSTLLDEEVKRRLVELNEPLRTLQLMQEGLKKEIRLSSSTPEIKATFTKLTKELTGMTKKFKALPPITEELPYLKELEHIPDADADKTDED